MAAELRGIIMNRWELFKLLANLDWKPFTDADWYGWADAGKYAHTADHDDKVYVRSVDRETGELCFEWTDPKTDDRDGWNFKQVGPF